MEWINLAILCLGIVFIIWLLIPVIAEFRKKYQSESFENNDEKAIEALRKDVDQAQKSIHLVGGVAFPLVYNDPEIVKSLKGAHERGVDIKMIFGSTIYADKTGNSILDLADKGVLELFRFRDGIPFNHFRIIDERIVYKEEPHAVNSVKRQVKRLQDARCAAYFLEKQFQKMLALTDVVPRGEFIIKQV